MIVFRMIWRDWGFAASIFGQAKHFLELARRASPNTMQEGYVRASIVFFLISFEAYYFEIIRGYIQANRATIPPAGLKKVEDELQLNTGIHEAVRYWPKYLTSKSLAGTKVYQDFVKFTKYRNALVHGEISREIPSWRKLAQDVETVSNAELAEQTIVEMIKSVAGHFGFDVPTWI